MRFNLQKLRYERLSRQISQDVVASALKISRSYYHKKETGKAKMTVDEFAKVLEVLEIPESEVPKFFTLEVPKREQNTA